ncbi:hypothetical protein [Bordetella sp. LUAb4]|uniref:hypothetical protein n=1 Tax=Bordetella sp. LUAb4 TaxID=2843195 RepID=UPI001E3B5F91|nr:hypothetical protein [Bordetella sp. LUAb4]
MNEQTWHANWQGIIEYFQQNGSPQLADALARRLADLGNFFSPSLLAIPGHAQSLLQAQQSLADLRYRVTHPDTPLARKQRVITKFLSHPPNCRRMDAVATSMGIAADQLGCVQGGWNDTKATLKASIARAVAKEYADTLIPVPDAGQIGQQSAVLDIPITNDILNSHVLRGRYGLREIHQRPTGHADKNELARKERESLDALARLDVQAGQIAPARRAQAAIATKRAKQVRMALDTAYAETARELDKKFTPTYVAGTLANDAMEQFHERIAQPAGAQPASRTTLMAAARATSRQMFGNENVLRPTSFLQGQADMPEVRTNISMLKFDVLAYMYAVHDLQGQLKTLGTADPDDATPYRLVTDSKTVWKVPRDKDTSWSTLREVPVEPATWAEFCAAAHDLSDPSVNYQHLIDGLLFPIYGQEYFKRWESQTEADLMAGLEQMSSIHRDAQSQRLQDLPAAFFEHPSTVLYLAEKMPVGTLREKLDLYFGHLGSGLQRANAKDSKKFLAALKKMGERLQTQVLLDFSPRHFASANLTDILQYLGPLAPDYAARHKNEIDALRRSARD